MRFNRVKFWDKSSARVKVTIKNQKALKIVEKKAVIQDIFSFHFYLLSLEMNSLKQEEI